MAKRIFVVDEDFPPGWINKYKVEKHWPLGYKIMFEENHIMWYFRKDYCEAICAMLNGAYNIGRSDRKLEYIFSGDRIDEAVYDLIDATDIGCIRGYSVVNLESTEVYVAVQEIKFFNIQRKAKALAQLLGKEYRSWQKQT